MGKTPFNISTGRWISILLGICVTQFVLLIGAVVLWSGHQRPPAGATVPRSTNSSNPFFVGHPGPWGELEFVRIDIEPPDEFIQVDGQHVFAPTRWFFPGYHREQLMALFNSCSLTAGQHGELLDTAAWQDETNGIVVIPSRETILGLDPATRSRIYSELSESDRNDFQCFPYTYRETGLDDWLGDSGLSGNTLGWLKRLIYHRGNSLCFSDLPQLFDQIPTTAEQRQAIKILSRNSTLLMRVRIHTNTDVAALTAYWSQGRRAKDIHPLLDSLTDVEGGISLDVAQLLPPFARKLLNTYPAPGVSADQAAPDCYWTSFNFFNDPPDNRFFDPDYREKFLEENYSVVNDAPTLGDVVLLLRPDDVPIHAAVYIADDVLFTKNGGNYRQPWILMKKDDLLARYPENYPLRLVFLRLKQKAN